MLRYTESDDKNDEVKSYNSQISIHIKDKFCNNGITAKVEDIYYDGIDSEVKIKYSYEREDGTASNHVNTMREFLNFIKSDIDQDIDIDNYEDDIVEDVSDDNSSNDEDNDDFEIVDDESEPDEE